MRTTLSCRGRSDLRRRIGKEGGADRWEEGQGGQPQQAAFRPWQPLAAALTLTPVTTHTKGEEQALVADAIGRLGVVLICWQHQDIPAIGNLIVGNQTTVPQSWPEDRYDLIWLFDRSGDARLHHHHRIGTRSAG